MSPQEYADKFSSDAHFRNQEYSSGRLDDGLVALKDHLEQNTDWKRKGFGGKAAPKQESNNEANTHMENVADEVVASDGVTSGELSEAQKKIEHQTGISAPPVVGKPFAFPDSVPETSAENILEGDNIFKLDLSKESSDDRKKFARAILGKEEYAKAIDSVTAVEGDDGVYVIKFKEGKSLKRV